jgi:acyl-coenzyme A thioesterase PaaI-like protein
MMPPSLDQARAALAAQPFSRLLGAQLNRFGPDGVELEVPVRPAHRQQHGFAHGGLLGYAADNALTLVAGAVAGPDVLTAGYTSTCSRRSSATPARPSLSHQRWPAAQHHRLRADRAAPRWRRLSAIAQGIIARST